MYEWYWVTMAFMLGFCVGAIIIDLQNNIDDRDKEIPWGF